MNNYKNEHGIALIATMMFLMAMGVLSTALVFTVHNEVNSSAAYKYSQQAFYVSNAGIQKTVQWYRNSYTPSLGAYNLTPSPPQYSGQTVMIAGQSGYSSNYPNGAMVSSFANELSESSTQSDLQANSKNTGKYAVNATLLKYIPAQFINPSDFTAPPVASSIERWRINSTGYWGPITKPLGIAQITAVIENNGDALFDRALWGIDEVNLTGTSYIDSYDPTLPMPNSGNMGSIGSNNLVTGTGSMTVNGDVAYGPNGSISLGNNVTVTGSTVHLAQDRYFPPIPNFPVGSGAMTVNPNTQSSITAGTYGKITVRGDLTLGPGSYYIDELSVSSQGQLIITGSTTLFVKTKLDMTGQAVSNDPNHVQDLTVFYSGTADAKWTGGTGISASVYAPNSPLHLGGGSDFYGSFIGYTVDTSGGTAIHFDQGNLNRNLIYRPFRIITWSQNTN